MSVVAVYKWAMNPRDERVGVDGSIKWSADRPEVGDDDHAAIQVARDLSAGNPVVGLTMANGDIAFGAARGIENTVAIEGVDILAQQTELAAALAKAVQDMDDASIVSIGDCAWAPMVPTLVAGILGWPCITMVDAARLDGDEVIVTRRFGTGTQDIAVTGPVVLSVAARREEESKPGMRAVLAARKKPVTKVAADTGCAATLQEEGIHDPEARASRVYDGADLDAAVAQLVTALKNEGVL